VGARIFPALFICIAFTDLLGGLHAGKLWPNLEDLKRYAAKFIRHSGYTPDQLNMLYECLRHKVAHLTYPYAVFDTVASKIFKSQPKRLVTWTIYDRRPQSNSSSTRARVSLRKTKRRGAFRTMLGSKFECADFTYIIKSIRGPRGYLKHLESDTGARGNFAKFLKGYFPP
jgi:hypothetical protein